MNPSLATAIGDAFNLPAVPIDADTWGSLAQGDPSLGFIGLFVSAGRVFALFEHQSAQLLLTTDLIDDTYPSIAAGFPQAGWFERLARDLTGVAAADATDHRAAIAHAAAGTDAAWPRFIETPCEGGYQIGTGPVAGLIATPVHRRLSLDGAQILRAEHRLGHAHRGIAGLMRGKSPRVAARFAARITGDATVAHSVAFACAAEAAAATAIPARAAALRTIMLAIERITADLAALAAAVALAGDTRFAGLLAQAREGIAIALGELFGHRLMMDIVVPGGLAVDIHHDAQADLFVALDQAALAVRAFDWGRVQRDLGLAAAIARARAKSVRAMARQVRDGLAQVPDSIIAQALPAATGMGLGAAASARGMVYHWLDLADGQIGDCCAIDPSARLLPTLEAAVVGLDVAQAAIMTACYGLSVSAIDG